MIKRGWVAQKIIKEFEEKNQPKGKSYGNRSGRPDPFSTGNPDQGFFVNGVRVDS
jgi:hypothetical protein